MGPGNVRDVARALLPALVCGEKNGDKEGIGQILANYFVQSSSFRCRTR